MRWADPFVSESGVESRGIGFTVYRGVAIVFDLWWKRVSWRPFWWRAFDKETE
jgi:hypothetical protein